MKRHISFALVCFTLIFMGYPTESKSQLLGDGTISSEAGINIGMMNALTDLSGNPGVGGKFLKDYAWANTHPCFGAYFNATYNSLVGIRVDATFGKVSGDDNPTGVIFKGPFDKTNIRQNRNLRFQSKINEINLLAEFHPLGLVASFMDEEGNGPSVSPYVMAGIGYFSFNPQAINDKTGELVDLQPLCTEGQGFKEYSDRKPYSLKQMNIPLGLGVKFNVSNTVRIRTEFVYRKLFTDYLDDVSTTYISPSAYSANGFDGAKYFDALDMNNRELIKYSVPGGKRGNPDSKDSFFSFNLKIGINIDALMGVGDFAY